MQCVVKEDNGRVHEKIRAHAVVISVHQNSVFITIVKIISNI